MAENVPSFTDVAIERERFVLREDVDLAQLGIEAIRQRDVDDAVDAAEGHRRLGPVARERIESLAHAAR